MSAAPCSGLHALYRRRIRHYASGWGCKIYVYIRTRVHESVTKAFPLLAQHKVTQYLLFYVRGPHLIVKYIAQRRFLHPTPGKPGFFNYTLFKAELDKACKDKAHEIFSDAFCVEMEFLLDETPPVPV